MAGIDAVQLDDEPPYNVPCPVDFLLLAHGAYPDRRLALRDTCAQSAAPIAVEAAGGRLSRSSRRPRSSSSGAVVEVTTCSSGRERISSVGWMLPDAQGAERRGSARAAWLAAFLATDRREMHAAFAEMTDDPTWDARIASFPLVGLFAASVPRAGGGFHGATRELTRRWEGDE
ncbi:MAG: hypothetical protein U0232_09460 [Thermomicrobiales bacterium]